MKSPRQKLIKNLDTLVRLQVRARDNMVCQKCGRQASDVSHVIPRGSMRLRWDMTNLKMLCRRCHLYWWHKNPLEAAEWFKNTFPERATYLERHKHDVVHFSVAELEDLYEKLKTKSR